MTMSETNEPKLSAQDKADLRALGADPAPKMPLLRVWQEVLSNIEANAQEKLLPGMASRVVSAWPKLTIQEVPRYFELYYDKLTQMRDILTVEIETSPDALKDVEDDGVENSAHYLNLLLQWQTLVLMWEHEWDATSPEAHLELAALADAQGFILSDQGLAAHLDEINFSFGDEEREAMTEALEEWKADQ